MLEWLKIGFGIGLGLILAVLAFILALGIIDAVSVKLRWWAMKQRSNA